MNPRPQTADPRGARRGETGRPCATRTSRSIRCPELLALIVGLGVGLAALAWAGPDDAAARYREGRVFFEAGRLPEALEAFRAAYQKQPLPRLLYLIGQVHLRLGQLEQATASLEAFLAAEPQLPKAKRQAVEALLAEAHRRLSGRPPAPAEAPPAPPTSAPPGPEQATNRPEQATNRPEQATNQPEQATNRPEQAAARPVALPAAALHASPPPARRGRPLHKQWWLWTSVAAVAAGAVVTTAVLASRAAAPGSAELPPFALCDWPGPCPARE